MWPEILKSYRLIFQKSVYFRAKPEIILKAKLLPRSVTDRRKAAAAGLKSSGSSDSNSDSAAEQGVTVKLMLRTSAVLELLLRVKLVNPHLPSFLRNICKSPVLLNIRRSRLYVYSLGELEEQKLEDAGHVDALGRNHIITRIFSCIVAVFERLEAENIATTLQSLKYFAPPEPTETNSLSHIVSCTPRNDLECELLLQFDTSQSICLPLPLVSTALIPISVLGTCEKVAEICSSVYHAEDNTCLKSAAKCIEIIERNLGSSAGTMSFAVGSTIGLRFHAILFQEAFLCIFYTPTKRILTECRKQFRRATSVYIPGNMVHCWLFGSGHRDEACESDKMNVRAWPQVFSIARRCPDTRECE